MNQIAASILVLSASICGYASAVRPGADGFGGLMSLIALGLGLWGGLALLTSVTVEREVMLDEPYEPRGPVGLGRRSLIPSVSAPSRGMSGSGSILGAASRDYRLTPETNAQVSMAAQVNGRSRQDVIEDILQRNLPRYNSRVA